MLELFYRGGPVMYPLVLCSIVALTVFLERLWSLRKSKIIARGLCENITSDLSQGTPEKALSACDTHISSPIARIAKAGLIQIRESSEMIRFMVAEIGGQEAANLEKNIRVIATIAYIAPLLGLLGTVSGMIKAFDTIAHHSVGDPTLLAGGISEALLTTAAGLMVAIPAVVMHKIVQSTAARRSLDLEKESVGLTEQFIKYSQSIEKTRNGESTDAPRSNSGDASSVKPTAVAMDGKA